MKYHTIAHNNTLLLFGEKFGNKWVTLQKKGNIAKVTKRNAHQFTGIVWERVTLQKFYTVEQKRNAPQFTGINVRHATRHNLLVSKILFSRRKKARTRRAMLFTWLV